MDWDDERVGDGSSPSDPSIPIQDEGTETRAPLKCAN